MALMRVSKAGAGGDIFNILAGYTVTVNEYNTGQLPVTEGDIVFGGVRTASTQNGDIGSVSSDLELLSDPSSTGVGHDYGIWKVTTTGTTNITITRNAQSCFCVIHKV